MSESKHDSFAALLASRNVDPETAQQATRYWVSEVSDDADENLIWDDLLRVANENELEAARNALARDPDLLEQASLAVLADAWNEPSERERVERVMEDAKGKMPVIEVGLLATVVLYGLYLRTTGGKKSEHIIVRHPDGTSVERATEWHDVSGPLGRIVSIFGGSQ